MTDNIKKIVIAFLILTIFGLAYYGYTNNKKHLEIERVMHQEKLKILKDLSVIEVQYDIALSKNTTLTNDLLIQKENIIAFKDSLRKIKNTNWKLIKFYKNKIKGLSNISNNLLRINDSLINANNLLNSENSNLENQKDSLSNNLKNQSDFNNTLVRQNLDLAKKVSLAEKITANSFKITSYKERSNGKLSATEKARKVEVFKTSFVINENTISKATSVTIHVVITDPTGKKIAKKGSFTNTEGERIQFSDTTVIPYSNTAVPTDILTSIGNVKLLKGKYIVDFYINKNKVETIAITLR